MSIYLFASLFAVVYFKKSIIKSNSEYRLREYVFGSCFYECKIWFCYAGLSMWILLFDVLLFLSFSHLLFVTYMKKNMFDNSSNFIIDIIIIIDWELEAVSSMLDIWILECLHLLFNIPEHKKSYPYFLDDLYI